MREFEGEGGCFCGNIRYRVNGEVIWTGNCHCESCRRQTSSPLTTFFCIPTDAVSFSGDVPKHYISSPGVRRTFCGTCGSPLGFEADRRPGEIDLFTMTLDFPEKMSPEAHYFWNESVSWLHIDDDLEKRTGNT